MIEYMYTCRMIIMSVHLASAKTGLTGVGMVVCGSAPLKRVEERSSPPRCGQLRASIRGNLRRCRRNGEAD